MVHTFFRNSCLHVVVISAVFVSMVILLPKSDFAFHETRSYPIANRTLVGLEEAESSTANEWQEENFSTTTTSVNETSIPSIGTTVHVDTVKPRNPRILCWVMTSPDHFKTKAKAVKETWGRRCDILLFISSMNDADLPAVQLPVEEGRNRLWGKTREAFRYIWNHYRDQADWFFKADDDTYAVVENLRYFLSGYDSSKPMWFGHKFKTIVKQGYFSGGAGYVLSKEAVRRFVEEGYFNALICRHSHEGAEDAEMGICMSHLNVTAMDTRDSRGRGRFFPFAPIDHLFPGKPKKDFWYWNSIYYPVKEGLECCSDTAISFHYINEQQMYLLEYLIYQLKPFGMESEVRPATPEPPPDYELTATPWSLPLNL